MLVECQKKGVLRILDAMVRQGTIYYALVAIFQQYTVLHVSIQKLKISKKTQIFIDFYLNVWLLVSTLNFEERV